MAGSIAAPAAEQVMARAGKTFHQAARLLPAGVRQQVTLLYAFCRTVDDLADDESAPVAQRQAVLLRLLQALELGESEELMAHGWWLGDDGRRRAAAAVLVRAALADLRQVQPMTEEEVLAYAFGVAGSVGLLMADVLQADSRGTGAAVALGCAMQLSNICRDVADDAANGRAYLPANVAPRAAIDRALYGRDAEAAERVRCATRLLLRRADALYRVAEDGMWSLPARVRWSILVAAMCYREIGVRVGADIERSWRERTVVSRGRKLLLLFRASARMLAPRLWRRRRQVSWRGSLGSEVDAQMQRLGVSA